MKKTMMIRLEVYLLLSVLVPCLTEATVVRVDPVKKAIDAFYEEGLRVDGFHPARMELELIIEDADQRNSHREYAIQHLAQLARATQNYDTQDYFLRLVELADEDGRYRQVRGYAFLAYSRMSVHRLDSEDLKVAKLRDLLTVSYKRYAMVPVRTWAAAELCNRGVEEALPEIERALRDSDSKRAPKSIAVCREKMHRLNSGEPRIKMLADTLALEHGDVAVHLRYWAIDGLSEIGSEEAQQHLVEFALRKVSGREAASRAGLLAVIKLKELGWSFEALAELGVNTHLLYDAGLVSQFVLEKMKEQEARGKDE